MTPSSEDIAAFAGANGKYYARAWERWQTKQTANAGFNGAAFFFSYFWLLYRRLYDIAAIYGGILVAEAIATDWFFTSHLGMSDARRSWDMLARVVFAVTSGQFGNMWYLRRAARNIQYSTEHGKDPTSGGGTNVWALIIGSAALVLAAGLAFFILGVVQGYTKPEG